MTAVSIEGLNKHFGAIHTLRNINLHVEEGEFVALIGPSGCGKSTLLRIVAGLEGSTSGAIRIGSRDVTQLPSKQRDIAMVFQSYALYPHMTVAENLGFCLRMQKRPESEIKLKVLEAARTLHLEALLERRPKELSGGQRQRVAMGRAIVRDPQVFLFDEPLSNLDAKLRVVMRSEIKEVQQRLMTTTIYVTHDQIEAMTMADRIVIMDKGEIIQIDTPMELYRKPRNTFVAGFIGSPQMNFIDARRDGNGGVSLGKQATFRTEVDVQSKAGEFVVGIRPEDLLLDQEDGLRAKVTLVEPTGSQTYIHACTEDGTSLVTIENSERKFRSGDYIRLKPVAQNLHFFDRASGERLSLA
ncbi:sn-glycerol-3-phosphate ABC transporter ATP-binding protein UgpC [Agrobacterium vitis]|uniref:Sn-glycerol-3-phosphate ABC transporter ATP-binding protein UgpC n=1 Tax=Agrobacterium vitis TaxID=373 RepID=A0AAE2R940_AGRVI|nr:sn-glycerol-3-phosphate ABC transporter ATP-binding protein UgpC [Agrobacterium vitis]MBF2714040.1 sn-glycerol-3-phosphate ABC transporter ATP-binding protein UgpC [Agrobacterium vitis]